MKSCSTRFVTSFIPLKYCFHIIGPDLHYMQYNIPFRTWYPNNFYIAHVNIVIDLVFVKVNQIKIFQICISIYHPWWDIVSVKLHLLCQDYAPLLMIRLISETSLVLLRISLWTLEILLWFSELTKIRRSSFRAKTSWFGCCRCRPWCGRFECRRSRCSITSHILATTMITILTTWLISSILIPSTYHSSFSENGWGPHGIFSFTSNKVPKAIVCQRKLKELI